jgi:hypothetical protein
MNGLHLVAPVASEVSQMPVRCVPIGLCALNQEVTVDTVPLTGKALPFYIRTSNTIMIVYSSKSILLFYFINCLVIFDGLISKVIA